VQHGLHGFFDALRIELSMVRPNHTMTVTTAVIGSVDTASVRQISHGVLDEFRRESPEDVALAIVGVSCCMSGFNSSFVLTCACGR
jgi:hypothetical protein